MKTERVIRWSAEILADGDKTTDEIKNYINKRSRHGTTSHALGNILSKHKRFQKKGKKNVSRGWSEYKVTIWGLNKQYIGNMKPKRKNKSRKKK